MECTISSRGHLLQCMLTDGDAPFLTSENSRELELKYIRSSSSHALPFFSPPSFHTLSLSPAFTSVWWSVSNLLAPSGRWGVLQLVSARLQLLGRSNL
jgi:hypothetical protein